jgi:hypothetical protein
MKRILLISALGALLAACTVQNRSSIEITGRPAPDSIPSCLFTPSSTTFESGAGTLDVSFPALSYRTMLQVVNNLADPTTLDPTAVKDTKAWSARSVRIRVNPADYVSDFGASPALLTYVGTNATTVLQLDGSTTSPTAKGLVDTELVSPTLGADLRASFAAGSVSPLQRRRIVLGVTLQGETLDGAKLDSGEWFFPIDICEGCLNSTSTPAPAAPSCATGTAPSAATCFFLGQDAVVTCAPVGP